MCKAAEALATRQAIGMMVVGVVAVAAKVVAVAADGNVEGMPAR